MRSNPIVRSAAYRFLRRLDSDSCKPYLFLFRYRALLVVQPLIPVHLSKYFGVRSLQILGESNWEVSDCESLYQFGYDCVVVDPHFFHDVELTLLCGFWHTLISLSLTDCLMAWSFSQFTKKSHRLAVDTGNLTTSNASFGHMTHTGSYVFPIFVPCLGHTSSWHATDIWFVWFHSTCPSEEVIDYINQLLAVSWAHCNQCEVVCVGFSKHSGGCITHTLYKVVGYQVRSRNMLTTFRNRMQNNGHPWKTPIPQRIPSVVHCFVFT